MSYSSLVQLFFSEKERKEFVWIYCTTKHQCYWPSLVANKLSLYLTEKDSSRELFKILTQQLLCAVKIFIYIEKTKIVNCKFKGKMPTVIIHITKFKFNYLLNILFFQYCLLNFNKQICTGYCFCCYNLSFVKCFYDFLSLFSKA